ncbi:hypothetical protein N7449_004945 [Penicillium cf. viridicatum]|uniref:Uncharacterized protein n=1 Tax=Penicillium cf. viridicatum TaxID=2972119 RepID=A0A9W9SYS4_9EURO|nr:hypothetical protein N7449_004945 [Penicillium cf. viridicatum]
MVLEQVDYTAEYLLSTLSKAGRAHRSVNQLMLDEQQCTPDTGNTKRALEGRTTQRNSGNLPILFTF